VTILLNIVLAFTESIPELDRLVARTGHDLPVISAKADGKDVGRVANEAPRRLASVQIPKTEGMVPGRRQSELTVRGDNDVRNKVVMAVENALWVPIGIFIASQLPDDDGLVCRRIKNQMSLRRKDSLSDLPREAVRIMSGFSEDVAMAVTHPLCPSKEPR
jgi:hypothetical protein